MSGLFYEVYIFFVLALNRSEIDQRQEDALFLFSFSFDYGHKNQKDNSLDFSDM